MFWLGYLYKKIPQNGCEQQVRTINEKGFEEFKREQKTLANQISREVLREARHYRLIHERRMAGDTTAITREEALEAQREATLMRELQTTYKVETTTGILRGSHLPEQEMPPTANVHTLESVRHLWDDHSSIFSYEREHLRQYLERLERTQDNGGERNLAQIISIMDIKWQRMDRYWF